MAKINIMSIFYQVSSLTSSIYWQKIKKKLYKNKNNNNNNSNMQRN